MLDEIRVVEVGGTVAAAAAGDLFQKMGATVTRLSPDDVGAEADSSMRGRLLEILRREKDVVTADLWDEAGIATVEAADVVIVDLTGMPQLLADTAEDSYENLVERHNAATWVTISPYGLHGPKREWLGTEITHTASGGFMHYMRSSEGRPMKPAGFTSSITAGHFSALAALHGILRRRSDDAPIHLDFAIQSAVAATSVFLECAQEFFDCAVHAGSSRQGPPSGLVECGSGLLWLMVVEDHHWKGFLRALGNPAWADGIETVKDREANAERLRIETAQWALNHTSVQAASLLQAEGVPATVVNSAVDLVAPACPDVRPGFFLDSGVAGERLPDLPFTREARSGSGETGDGTERDGGSYRVLDVCNVLAGPLACSWLGAMGVDVLKVEDSSRLDVYRRRGPFPNGVQDFEASAYFSSSNYSKRSYAVPLDEPAGLERLAELMASADVVVTNVSAHRAQKIGVVPSALEASSGTVLVSSGGFSQLAPNATYRCFGLNCHASGGVVDLSRDREGNPNNPTIPWADPLTSIWIATLALTQLLRSPEEREHANVSMTEVVAFEFPEYFSRMSRDGVQVRANENHVDHAAPHNTYRCSGDDAWVAIACETDAAWARLVEALGDPVPLADSRFDSVDKRLALESELDELLERECIKWERDELVALLQRSGVPATGVYSAKDLIADQHLAERELFQKLDHPRWGRRALTGLPWRIVGEGTVRITATPLLGANTDDDPNKWWKKGHVTYVNDRV